MTRISAPEESNDDATETRWIEDVIAETTKKEFGEYRSDRSTDDDNEIAHAVIPGKIAREHERIDEGADEGAIDVDEIEGLVVLLRDEHKKELA